MPHSAGSPTLEEVFGRGLRRIRTEQGMKQEALAAAAGYKTHTNIAKMERGHTLPSFEKALMLARILHVPVEAFVLEGYAAEGLDRTYREVLATSVECRTQFLRFLRAIVNDLEQTLEPPTTVPPAFKGSPLPFNSPYYVGHF